jgi:pimeloyl-ACP methyl ester carboxylesterase
MTTAVEPRSKTLEINGLRVRYLEWGDAGAPPVVCVHGYTSSAETFNALARRFQDRVRLIVPDVRGHGESAWSPQGTYQYADQAGDLAALVDALTLDRFTLIGTSMGGIIAMTYAGGHAERLAGLVLNDIGPDVEDGSKRITSMVGGRPETFATLEDAIEWRRQASPVTASRSPEDQRELALGVLRRDAAGAWGWKMDPAYITQRVQQGPPRRPDLWPVLAKVPCPTLVVWGTASDVLSEAQARRMVAVLPHGELVSVPGVAHAPTLVEPVVLAALERLLGRSTAR